jgi:hypothetical protein
LTSPVVVVAAGQTGGVFACLEDSLGLMAARPADMIVRVAGWSRGEKSSTHVHAGMP